MTVAVVIVTYHNSEMLSCLLEDLTAQSRPPDCIIVVDNTGSEAAGAKIAERFPTIEYIRMPENAGSAGGYHEGLRVALDRCDLIWTLDDDVRLRRDTLDELLKGFDALRKVHKLGAVRCVGPNHKSFTRPLPIIPWRGTLFCREALLDISLPQSEYFLYGEDLDYSFRLAHKGYRCFYIPSSVCFDTRNKGKAEFKISSHTIKMYSSPFRLYYAFRNETAIYLKYRALLPFLRTMLYSFKVILFSLIFSGDGKKEKVQAILKGIADGLSGRLGKNPRYNPIEEQKEPKSVKAPT